MSKLELGVNHGISNHEYHADTKYISSSGLKKLYWDELAYEREYILGEREVKQSNALDEGTAIHTLILEPELAEGQLAYFPGFRKAGLEYDQFMAANQGKIVLSAQQKMRLDGMVKAYKARPEAVEIVNKSEKEFTICETIMGVPVKIRCDAIDLENHVISDIKSTSYSAEIDIFKSNAYSKLLSYDISAALYTMVAEKHFGEPFDFYYIVISKSEYVCEIYKSSEPALINGRNKVLKALEKLKYYREHNKWPASTKKKISASTYEILEL